MTQQRLSSAASSQLELSIQRIFSAAATLLGIETSVNWFTQRELLNPLSFLLLGLLLGLNLILLVTAFGKRSNRRWIRGHSYLVLVIVWLFPLTTLPELLTPQYQPWIWWSVGAASVGAGFSHGRLGTVIYQLLMFVSWILVDTSYLTGGGPVLDALQDAIYCMLFSSVLISVIYLLRIGAERVDSANDQVLRSAIEQAKLEAINRERQRLDALVHDRVLHSLLLAGGAQNREQQLSAAAAAKDAIESLEQMGNPGAGEITPIGLFTAMEDSILKLAPNAEIVIRTTGVDPIPGAVSQAITEATLQALENALQHSKADRIRIDMDSSGSELMVRISDNGIGFRIERLPADRIGLKTSIVGRMKLVGGSTKITSSLGKGAVVELRWKP